MRCSHLNRALVLSDVVLNMTNRKVKKNQHYVPKSHLKRFTIEGEKSLIWSFDKVKGEFGKLPASKNKVCAEDYYYYQITKDNKIDHTTLEDRFSEIETSSNNAIDRLLACRKMPYIHLTRLDREQVAFYIALMLVRGPSFRDAISEIYGHVARVMLNKVWDESKAPEVLQQLVRKYGLSNVVDISVNSTVSLEHMINSAEAIAKEFLKKGWVLINAPRGRDFVTSDVPVVFYPYKYGLEDVGPAHPNAEILFPICKSSALIMTPAIEPMDEVVIGNYSDFLLDDINTKVAKAANKYIYCSEQYSWLKDKDLGGSQGQRLTSGVDMTGINIVTNPWKRKN